MHRTISKTSIATTAALAWLTVPMQLSAQSPPRAPEPDAQPSAAASVSWQSVAENMQSAQALLAAGDAGSATQARQRDVLAGLDAMLAAAEAASQGQRPSPKSSDPSNREGGDATGTDGSAANPNAKESVERHGADNAAAPETVGPRRSAAEEFWGLLPDRVRQQVLQSADAKAVPKYREAVEEYFQRLLDAKRGGAARGRD